MNIDTAYEIVSAINSIAMAGMGIGNANIDRLRDVDLADYVSAIAMVEAENAAAKSINGTRSMSLVPDQRLAAAVYALLHYAVPPYHLPGEDDDAVVHVVIKGHRHGLVMWCRPVTPDDDEDDPE